MSAPVISRSQPAVPVEALRIRPALAALSLAMLLSSLGTSSANVALPTLAAASGASFREVQWVVLAYLLAVTTLIVGLGRLGDVVGRRRLLAVGIALFTIASLGCAFAQSLPLLILARAVQGTGAAIMMALTVAFVGDILPKDKTGRAMGLLGTMSAVGTALGPSLGGLLIAGPGWRAIFAVNVPLGLAALHLAHRSLPVDPARSPASRRAFDLPGTATLALTLAAYALAMTVGRGRLDALNGALLAAAAAGVGLFVVVERRADAPLIRLHTLRDPTLAAGLAASAIVSTVMMATLVVGPFYLSRALGLDAATVGIVVTAGPLVAALTAASAGRLSDRYGATATSIGGLAAIAAGCALLAMLPAASGIAGYVAPIVAVTAGYAAFQTANNAGVMRGVQPERRGVVSGLLGLSRNLGLVTGASAMGAVFAFGASVADVTTADPSSVAAGMRTTFAVAALLIGVALALAIAAANRAGVARTQGPSSRAG